MDQKLWMFENFKRNVGRAGMYWSHMGKNMWARRKKTLQGGNLGHPCRVGRQTTVACWSQP